eukprot:scaffold5061_cov378-Prasinococcus_capsulatus_cf.AAC.5
MEEAEGPSSAGTAGDGSNGYVSWMRPGPKSASAATECCGGHCSFGGSHGLAGPIQPDPSPGPTGARCAALDRDLGSCTWGQPRLQLRCACTCARTRQCPFPRRAPPGQP